MLVKTAFDNRQRQITYSKESESSVLLRKFGRLAIELCVVEYLGVLEALRAPFRCASLLRALRRSGVSKTSNIPSISISAQSEKMCCKILTTLERKAVFISLFVLNRPFSWNVTLGLMHASTT